MNKIIVAVAAAIAMSFTAVAAEAGPRGKSSYSNKQTGQFTSGGGLINVSPNISLGGLLNGSAILSGNSIGNGILSNIGVGLLGTGILSQSSSKTVKNSYNNGRNGRR